MIALENDSRAKVPVEVIDISGVDSSKKWVSLLKGFRQTNIFKDKLLGTADSVYNKAIEENNFKLAMEVTQDVYWDHKLFINQELEEPELSTLREKAAKATDKQTAEVLMQERETPGSVDWDDLAYTIRVYPRLGELDEARRKDFQTVFKIAVDRIESGEKRLSWLEYGEFRAIAKNTGLPKEYIDSLLVRIKFLPLVKLFRKLKDQGNG